MELESVSCKGIYKFFFLMAWIIFVNGAPQLETNVQESCVLSLTIPKDSIKSSCNMNEQVVRKMHSMESQFNHFRTKLGALEIRLPEIVLNSNRYGDKVEQLELVIAKESTYYKHMDQRIKALEEAVAKDREGSSAKHITEPDTLLDPIRPLIMAELQQMKEDLRRDLTEEIRKEKEKEEKISKETLISSVKPMLLAEMQYVKEEILKSMKNMMSIKILDQTEEIGSSDEVGNHIVEDVVQPENHLNMVADQSVMKDEEPLLKGMARTLHSLDEGNVTILSNKKDIQQLENLTKEIEFVEKTNDNFSEKSEILVENLQKTIEILQNVAKTNLAKDLDEKIDKLSTEMEIKLKSITNKCNEIYLTKEVKSNELEDRIDEISQNFTLQNEKVEDYVKKLNLSDDLRKINTSLSNAKIEMQSMDRRIDSYTNDVYLDTKIQTKVENIKSSLQLSLMGIQSNLASYENKLSHLERQNNLSSTLLNHFKKTLIHNHNQTDVNFENVKSEITEIENRLKEEMTQKMNTKSLESRLEGLETEFMFFQSRVTTLQKNSTIGDNKLDIKLAELNSKTQSIDWQLTSLHDHAQRILEIERNQTLMKNNYDLMREVMKLVHLEQKLRHNRWIEFNFTHHSLKNSCHKKQYVKRNPISKNGLGAYVGVQLCTSTRYKILLGNSLDEEFLDIGDQYGHGQDHCQFIGGESEYGVTVDTEFPSAMGMKAFMRKQWDEKPHLGFLSFMTPTPSWYECGMSLP
ncbi:putative leucine-rich repeat-containing protein DDB_G0290503 [Mytilus trossulus]|uniref:putative leucine-rich repeat-containing protein DDB_G0290503 n=1 Tax=Mytilus trossulus TaxID=6551 RepID=UPI00300468B2